MLIVARFVTGVSAGFMAPAGLSIITTTFAEGPRATGRCSIYAGDGRGRASRSAWSSAGC